MDPDLIFVLAVGIFALVIPAVISAFSSSDKSLRPAVFAVVIGGTMILWAMSQTPGGYSLAEIPSIIVELLD